MSRQKIEFPNAEGVQLAGLLELPTATPLAWALFAHCFTCGKDVAAASRIARALAKRGIAVLRFDFTGLGNSDGDFANTNFSSNVEDLLAAANWLRETHQAPSLIIGHSLGGAAVLRAAHEIPELKAVCTIAAPATASHVSHLFEDAIETIQESGKANVRLGSREFTIKQQLLTDLDQYGSTAHIAKLGKPLLIFHSPVDATVGLDNAAAIYGAAKHPKSFVSLDDADHLLTRRVDAAYVGGVLAAWATRYLGADPAAGAARGQSGQAAATTPGLVVVEEDGGGRFSQRISAGRHLLTADEPVDVCVFLECASGGDVQSLMCSAASNPVDSPEGRPGCCGESAALVEGYDCSGFGGKDANVYISISSSAKICADYDLDYSF